MQFLSGAERNAARAVWDAVQVVPGGDDSVVQVEEAARIWGFTDV